MGRASAIQLTWRAIWSLAAALGLIIGAVVAAAAGAPPAVYWTLLILVFPCGVAAFRLFMLSGRRGRIEQDEVTRRGLERIKHMNLGSDSPEDRG